MPTVISIDPVTRLEGHLKIEATVDYVQGVQQVVDAHAVGTMFRGLETILMNRNPLDAPDITQRICGVCPVSHGMAASTALDRAANVAIPDNARIMRNLVLGLQLHPVAHPAFLPPRPSGLSSTGPDMAPWQPSWHVDKRVTGADSQTLVSHYVTALDMRRKAHEMGALFGGRLPHPPAFVPGGFTTTPPAGSDQQVPGVHRRTDLVYRHHLSAGCGHARTLLRSGVFADRSGNRQPTRLRCLRPR